MTPATPLEDIARTIAGDIAAKRVFTPYAGAIGDLAAACRVQDRVKDELLHSGARSAVAGFKIAMNTAEQMRHFRVEEPVAAFVFADARYDSPASRPLSAFRAFAYEPEICAIFAAPLVPRQGGYEAAEVVGAIERFVPAFELLDGRDAVVTELSIVDVVAQNVNNEGGVIGGPGLAPADLDAHALRTVVRENGRVQLDVTGGRPQDPLEAATFVVNHMGARGHAVGPDTVILCGAHQPPRPLREPTLLELDMSPLGTAVFELAAE